MRKVFVLILICLMCIIPLDLYAEDSLKISDVFTDEGFRSAVCVLSGIHEDTLLAGSEESLGKITHLNVSGMGIKDISGVKYLRNLTFLDIADNNIEAVDLSENALLEYLICDNNPIEEIYVENCGSLLSLYANNCKLTKISLPSSVVKVYLMGNEIDRIDISQLTELEELNLRDNDLTEIDITENAKMKYLWLSGNRLDMLNIPEKREYEQLIIGTQAFTFGMLLKDNYCYIPTDEIFLTDKHLTDGKMIFTPEEAGKTVSFILNISGRPMNVEMTVIDMSGDVNNDNIVNSDDLSMLLAGYGTDDTVCDVNLDGKVSAEDLSVVIGGYGNVCDK